ncbi:MAG: putative transposase [Pseudonocardiales bacterium]|nr:putative transposase [Pseudonocardiales bacterium]
MGRPSRYPEEFRREAVQMALASNDSRASVARRLGVNETTLRNWVANELAEQARQANPLSVSPSEFEELRRLRREVAELRVEKEILRKAAAYFAQDDPVCRFRFVADHRHAYGVKRLCRVLAVSRSGFYAFTARTPSPREIGDTQLSSAIAVIYERSHRTYGAPRVHAELSRVGWRCGRKRVARLMRAHHLVGAHTRRRWRTARPEVIVSAADLVRRNFDPSGPDLLWAADVTQIRTGEGWLYLAAVLDLWSRRVVGWAMGNAVNAELVGDALLMAFQRRRPDRRVVHHSDRGAVGEFNWSSQHLDQEVRGWDGQQIGSRQRRVGRRCGRRVGRRWRGVSTANGSGRRSLAA